MILGKTAIIDRQKLAELAMLGDLDSLKESHAGWLQEKLPAHGKGREDQWSTSIAVGGEYFVTGIKQLLGIRAAGRKIVNGSGASELREPFAPYNGDLMPENDRISAKIYIYGIFILTIQKVSLVRPRQHSQTVHFYLTTSG